MKKTLLSTFAMFLACFGVANAGIEMTAVSVEQPANDTLLFALPVDLNVYQDIQNYIVSDNGAVSRFMKFQPEYLVTAQDFTKGDTEKGTATLPNNAKVIGLGLDGYDMGSQITSKGVFLETTAWCRNIPVTTVELDYLDMFDGYRSHFPQGQLLTDTITYHGYQGWPGFPGFINTFDLEATAENPCTIVDIPFGNPDDPHMPFWYTGENIYLTLWMCNDYDANMKYRYMAFDDAEADIASLMRSSNFCFNSTWVNDYPQMPYELPTHRLPAFRTPYYTNDVRVSIEGYDTEFELKDEDGNVMTPAEDGNFYCLDHTKTYTVFVNGTERGSFTFDDIYKDVDLLIQNWTAVDELDAAKTVSSVVYYNLAGQQSAQPVDGVNIIVTTYSDGTRTTAKIIK
ncbi:MAG: hypothetical protein IKX18_03250 [Muribaculaceae bacterium]|nr:hypothetical protein [Muribaculaceae bacterium]